MDEILGRGRRHFGPKRHYSLVEEQQERVLTGYWA